MRPRRATLGTAVVAGVGGVAGSYLVAGSSSAFVGAAAGSFVVRAAPAAVVSASITSLGDVAKLLAVATALGIVVAGYAAVALLAIRFGGAPSAAAVFSGLGAWWATILVTGAPLRSLGAGLPVAAVVGVALRGADRPEEFAPGRRRVLRIAAGVAGLGVAAYASRLSGVGLGSGGDRGRFERALDAETRADIGARLREADGKTLDVEGMTGLVSRIGEFYEVDISSFNPNVDVDGWELRVTGEVRQELAFSYGDLLARGMENRFVTLRCVGEPLNGHKMDNALWTGVPAGPILEEAVPMGGCECVMLRAADGYYEEFPLAALRRGFLAFGMNGEALPRKHGFPVRALIPGHWGEINVKWLTGIEVLDREVDGYWEERGWHGTGPVNTVAKLHAVDRLDGGGVRIGGHAYAGTRGVSAVEVSTDGGGTWEEAALSEPLPGEDVWRQWAYEFRPPGETEVVVRAVEADGTVQPRDRTAAFPSGASGWVSRTVSPR